jgi:hypothetical protein
MGTVTASGNGVFVTVTETKKFVIVTLLLLPRHKNIGTLKVV